MIHSPFFISPIEASEVDTLRKLAIDTFDETFSSTNSRENMDHYFNTRLNRALLGRELQDPNSGFWFARQGDEIGGYLKINIGASQTEMREKEGMEVERIYILRKYYGSGMGAALMEFALDRFWKSDKSYLWLGVHEENYRALRFYEKYGFSEFADHLFMMGHQPQRDLLLRLDR